LTHKGLYLEKTALLLIRIIKILGEIRITLVILGVMLACQMFQKEGPQGGFSGIHFYKGVDKGGLGGYKG
jgi:hypothetical protein